MGHSEHTDSASLAWQRMTDEERRRFLVAIDAVPSPWSDASPDEIRILSGLVRAMLADGGLGVLHHMTWPRKERWRAVAYVAAQALDGNATQATAGSAAWHIALALDALFKEGT